MRPLSEQTLRVWRLVAMAGVNGIGSSAVHVHFGSCSAKAIASADVTVILQTLMRGGYVEHRGVNRWGTWHVTPACKTPDGEERPEGLGEPPKNLNAQIVKAGVSTADDADDWPRTKTEVVMPAAPASVFTLGAQPPFALGRLQAPPSDESQQRSAQARRDHRDFEKATEGHAVLDWKAPGTAKPADDVLDALPPKEPRKGIPYLGSIDIDAVHHAQDKPAIAAPASDFVCSLNSAGEMYVYSEGVELILDLARTRKLLHYLDHLSAIELVASIDGAAA